ncbi:hypothetical protein [Pedobacter montanisoli]|uniref:Uncharacterized protein n=1 Tax=Pedobacter montanisoli TaxID=2923277 RepID=A0ABS9ZSX2_9SPHI|nr:hypothetical protein [Pedobacter montanisoli]MCJ0741690.1 hypothetical protein [Pedobacter montanisoli]
MKKVFIILLFLQVSLNSFAQDPNILIGLSSPALGINMKMNFPSYTGSWARGFTLSNENANPYFGLGVYGLADNGVTSFEWGWIGKSYDNSYMNFLANGNIGIGTSTPQEKLSVNGKIRAKEIKVETANWPDYVFSDNYLPKSLPEIEQFIKKNKHLPEVPSAQEAEQNGIELGEMNKILLKKIEELTLHLIEKDKAIQELYKRVERLEKNN